MKVAFAPYTNAQKRLFSIIEADGASGTAEATKDATATGDDADADADGEHYYDDDESEYHEEEVWDEENEYHDYYYTQLNQETAPTPAEVHSQTENVLIFTGVLTIGALAFFGLRKKKEQDGEKDD